MGTLWYMSKHEDNKFTHDLEGALKVVWKGQECPVLAPGYVNGYARIAQSRQRKLWEHLLDAMELEYDAIDAECDERTLTALRARTRSLEDAIAIMEYGVIDKNSLKLVKAQADIRYEQSMEAE